MEGIALQGPIQLAILAESTLVPEVELRDAGCLYLSTTREIVTVPVKLKVQLTTIEGSG